MLKKKAVATVAAAETETVDELVQPESKAKTVLNRIVNVILVIAIIIAAFATYSSFVSSSGNGVTSVFGIRVLSIQTESMFPTLEPGDMIFERGVKDTSTLQVGDIITYWTVINGERVLNTHRISEIYDGGNYLIFETKGDNNTVSDALTVHESEIVGQWKSARIKGLGKVFDYLQTSTGFLVVVVIPVAIFFVFHLIQFFRVLFEYQNVKQKLQYEMERGKTEEYVEEEKRRMNETRTKERERLEAELREKLKKEILASGGAGAAEPEDEATQRARMEEEIRAKIIAEAEEKKREEEKKAAMEAEIRARVMAEMQAEQDKEKLTAEAAAAEQKAAEAAEAERAEIEAEIRAKMEAEIRQKVEAELRAKAAEKE